MSYDCKNVLAIDVGGANLKIANGEGFARSCPFALWQQPGQLSVAIREMISSAPDCDRLAVTMTGELADCFTDKAAGVGAILDAVEQAATDREVWVYRVDGRLVSSEAARAEPMAVAASNWHALSCLASRWIEGETGLLVDIGSTTSDLIPLTVDGPQAVGQSDPERLATGELVYTGVVRSPICAVVDRLPWRGKLCRVAQEQFATTVDAYLLMGEMAEEDSNCETADGRPRTLAQAHARLARMICGDATLVSLADARCGAEWIRSAQLNQLSQAAEQVLNKLSRPPSTVVLSGEGEFLARQLVARLQLDATVVSLNERLGCEVSRAAGAHAVAVLAREWEQQ